MPGNERDPLDDWLEREIQPLPPPPGTFELIRKRARRRKAGRLAATVTSAAAVAVLATVGVPAALSLHLGPSATSAQVANGRPGSPAPSSSAAAPSTGASTATSSASPRLAPSGISETTSGGQSPPGGPVPANFEPTSVTFVSSNAGWAIGQAGTPGHCANSVPTICTSIVRTTDSGQTWRGIPAPSTNQVTGIRFLDGVNGWAYGPDLWSTHDGGSTWTQLSTGGQQVIDLETAGREAFALFANCSTATGGSGQDCTSYSLKATAATSDDWVDVGPATSDLPDARGAAPTLVLSGSTGWLLGADGTIYSGPLTGAWTKLGDAPCPATPSQSSLGGALLGYDTYTSKFVAACTTVPQSTAQQATQKAVIYSSGTTSLNWQATAEGLSGGNPVGLATTPSYQAILATSQGISVLDTSTGQWTQTVTLAKGFSYVGMTTKLRGVAIPADTSLHEIWMTFDGGRSWQPYPITP
ncbi:MAG TPA: hypothetical protein VMG38_13360 [Trebonia sp.]|nr:hypothetical protein [Trebonia sp.]